MSFHPAGGVGIDPGVPAPPPGPGAAPPFVSPPTDRNRRNLWIGLGVGGVVLLLCCVGGIFGIGLLIVNSTEEAKKQGTAAVTRYLDAVHDSNYRAAYRLLCDEYAARIGLDGLTDQARRDAFSSYRLSGARLSTYVEVPAHLQTSSGELNRLFQLDTVGTGLCIISIR